MFGVQRYDVCRTRFFGAGPRRAVAVTLICGALVGLAGCVGGDGGSDAIIDPNPNPVADTIGPAGGALTVGDVELVFPPNAVSRTVGITVREATTFPANPLLVAGAVYELRPTDLQFAEPVQLAVGYDPGALPVGVRESELRLYRASGLAWEEVSGSAPDEAADRVSGEIVGFSVYGVLGVPVASVSIAPETATIGPGETRQLTATPADAESLALPEREVVWTTSDAGVAEVDASGLVTGVAFGTADIRATSEGHSATATILVSAEGRLQVTTITTGRDLPAGYTVSLDGGSSQAIGTNGQVTFPDLEAGDYGVQLTGVASNCAVQGQNPRTVTVPAGGSGETTFSVDCMPVTGDIEVTTSTTGTDLDLDGYRVTLDGSTSRSIGTNDTEVFQNLEVRSHKVELTEWAINCSVEGSNPRNVDVEAGETSHVAFDISCVPLTGDLRVKTTTSGTNKPDHYVVVVDETEVQTIETKGEVDFLGLRAASHVVRLNVAPNCQVKGDNPRTVVVPFHDRVETKFEVSCSEADSGG